MLPSTSNPERDLASI